MATENTRTFTKVIAGNKYVLPRIVKLPFDAIEAIYEAIDAKDNAADERSQTRQTIDLVKTLKELVPALAEATKTLDIEQTQQLLVAWFSNEKKMTGTDLGKSQPS